MAGTCLLDWLSIKTVLTRGSWAVHHVASIPFGRFYLHSLLLAGHELLKVCQGLLRPARGPG